jgi:hypothetical protein
LVFFEKVVVFQMLPNLMNADLAFPIRTIENEIKERGYTWGTIERKANNREEWRKLVLAICAMRHSKD